MLLNDSFENQICFPHKASICFSFLPLYIWTWLTAFTVNNAVVIPQLTPHNGSYVLIGKGKVIQVIRHHLLHKYRCENYKEMMLYRIMNEDISCIKKNVPCYSTKVLIHWWFLNAPSVICYIETYLPTFTY